MSVDGARAELRRGSRARRAERARAGFFRDNVGMLAQHVSGRETAEIAKTRRENISLRSLRALRFLLIVLAAGRRSRRRSRALTFTKDIAPIIWTRCASCHRPGEIGPFSLITYDDVRQHATQIATVTARRIMPPWKPVAGKGDFQDERRLTDRRAAALQQWIADGAPEGDPLGAAADARAGATAGSSARPISSSACRRRITVPADGTDVFRTFVMPIPIDRGALRARDRVSSRQRARRASREPRRRSHAIVASARRARSRARIRRQHGARRALSRRAAARVDAGPGAACRRPTGTQWRLEPGSDLVVQLHLQPTGKARARRRHRRLLLHRRRADAHAGRPAAGQRDDRHPAGRARVRRRRSVSCCRWTSTCWPSSRTRTTSRGGWKPSATLPDGTTRWLIAIDDWDFRWQDVYRYAAPFVLPKGTTISMRYTYDNSAGNPRNPHRPPARVVWGQNTSDEMGDLWMQVIPRAAADEPILTADFRRKADAEDLAAYTKLLQGDPDNPLRHDAVAEPVSRRRAVRRGDRRVPAVAAAQSRLGADALQPRLRAVGARPARRGDRRVSRRRCGSIRTTRRRTTTSARCCRSAGQPDAALEHYRRAVALRPDNVEAHTNLGQLLSNRGRAAEAVAQFSDGARAPGRQRPGARRPRLDPRDRLRSVAAKRRRGGAARGARRRRDTSPGCNGDRRAGGGVRGGRPVRGRDCTPRGPVSRSRPLPGEVERSLRNSANGSSCIKRDKPLRMP